MQNYEQILAELGIEVPEDKKSDLKKKMSENYKTVADYDKQVKKKDDYKISLDDVQTRLAELEKEDVDGLKAKITTLTQELADEKEARAKEAKQTELRDKVKDFLSDKKFVNAITEDSIRSQMIQKLEEENGKNAEDVFKNLLLKMENQLRTSWLMKRKYQMLKSQVLQLSSTAESRKREHRS